MARITQDRYEELMNSLAGIGNNSDDTLTILSELRADFNESLNTGGSESFTREDVYGSTDKTWKQMYEESQTRYRDRFLGRIGDDGKPTGGPIPTPPAPNPTDPSGTQSPTIESLFADA